MNPNFKPIPAGYHNVTPYLIAKDADQALAFYQKVFGAAELMRLNAPDGKIAHAEFKIGDSIFMLSEENPAWGSASPKTLGGSPITLYLFVADVDATFAAAVAAGAEQVMPVVDKFWGDRTGVVTDPFGHRWHLATHVEDVEPGQLPARMEAFFASNPNCGG